MKMTIDTSTLIDELETLAAFSDAPSPAVTRIVFSEQDSRARAWLKQLYAEAGLEVREDAVGNTFARWPGSDPDLPAVGTGSHTDAIPHAGRYDGTVGVLGGLEAIRALQRSGFKPRRSIELLMFTSEEPTRFGIGCLGSRLLSGTLDPSAAASLEDSDGKHSRRGPRRLPASTVALESVALKAGYYAAFVELHIEQGPLLERRNVPLGIVTAIAAPASLSVTIEGQGGHAGAVLMPDRHDAFLAAAEIALALEAAARLDRGNRQRRHHRRLRCFSGRCEQHSEPRTSLRSTFATSTRNRRDGILAALRPGVRRDCRAPRRRARKFR